MRSVFLRAFTGSSLALSFELAINFLSLPIESGGSARWSTHKVPAFRQRYTHFKDNSPFWADRIERVTRSMRVIPVAARMNTTSSRIATARFIGMPARRFPTPSDPEQPTRRHTHLCVSLPSRI